LVDTVGVAARAREAAALLCGVAGLRGGSAVSLAESAAETWPADVGVALAEALVWFRVVDTVAGGALFFPFFLGGMAAET
jgi:hypothetical protein